MKVDERRRFPRAGADLAVRYRVVATARPEFHGAHVRDLGMGGMRFRTLSFLPLGARMLLELQLPSGPPVRAVGRAAWVRTLPNDDGYEVGSQFEDPGAPLGTAPAERRVPSHGEPVDR